MENFVGVLGTLAGVTLGGLISYFTNARQMAHENQLVLSKRQIEKLEATHEVLTKIGDSYRTLHSNTSFLITGKKSEERKIEKLPFDELEMLFSFYIPSHESRAQKLIEICQDYGASMVKANIFTPGTKEDKKKLWDELNEKYSDIELRIRELKQELAKIIKKYAL